MRRVDKPIQRHAARRALGREWFILRRRLEDSVSKTDWAAPGELNADRTYPVFAHRSLILRELAGVDMQLQENKRTNLRLAIRHIDGVVIKPGQVLSLWRLVGRPTRRQGYLEGVVLDQGKASSGIGGGLCQLSNLMFWIALHSPLQIVERHRHTFDVFPDSGRKVPFGAGATISYNYIDLRIANPTTNTYQLRFAKRMSTMS